MHCQLRIGNSMFLLHDEYAESGGESPQTLEGSPVTLHLYVDDADAAVDRAVKAGARVDMPTSSPERPTSRRVVRAAPGSRARTREPTDRCSTSGKVSRAERHSARRWPAVGT